MKFAIPILFFFLLISCSLYDDGHPKEPENYRMCNMEMDINGQPWFTMYPNDKTAYDISGSYLGDTQEHHKFDGYPMSVSCTRVYQSHFEETLIFTTVMPYNYSITDLASHRVNFLNPKYPEYERIRIIEWQYDYGLGRFDIDSTRAAYFEITEVDTLNRRLKGKFEGSLIIRKNKHSTISGRLPDTLRITNGRFDVEYQDARK